MAIGLNDPIPATDVGLNDIYTFYQKEIHSSHVVNLQTKGNLYNAIYSLNWYELDHYKNVGCVTFEFDAYTPPSPFATSWTGTVPTKQLGLNAAAGVLAVTMEHDFCRDRLFRYSIR